MDQATGPEHDNSIDALERDLACPSCEYNLRGLRGQVVDCPECGYRCDIARLIAVRWEKPWYRAPKFNVVLAPATVAFVGTVVMLIALPLMLDRAITALLPGMIALFTAVAWAWSLRLAYQVFHEQRGIWLALLGHVLVAGYFVGFLGLAASTIGVFLGILEATAGGGIRVMVAGGIFVVMALLCWLCRKGERYIAQQCIKQYLKRAPK